MLLPDVLVEDADIWLLARLIDEIAGGRDPQQLTTYVLVLMSVSTVFSLLCAGLTRCMILMMAMYRNFVPKYGKTKTQEDGGCISLSIALMLSSGLCHNVK